ncbi:MAG TPA: hypothetical protein VGB19_09300 [Actinomycetota bacterium]
MAAQRPASFNLSKYSTSSKILIGAGGVGIINAFISWWQHAKVCFGPVCASASRSALGGDASWAGVLMFIGLIALVAWEVANVMGALGSMNLPMPKNRITLIIAGVVVFFGLLKFFLALSHVYIGAFIGLIVILAIAYAAWMRYQEPEVAGGAPPAGPPPPPAGGGGGFTA